MYMYMYMHVHVVLHYYKLFGSLMLLFAFDHVGGG